MSLGAGVVRRGGREELGGGQKRAKEYKERDRGRKSVCNGVGMGFLNAMALLVHPGNQRLVLSFRINFVGLCAICMQERLDNNNTKINRHTPK